MTSVSTPDTDWIGIAFDGTKCDIGGSPPSDNAYKGIYTLTCTI